MYPSEKDKTYGTYIQNAAADADGRSGARVYL